MVLSLCLRLASNTNVKLWEFLAGFMCISLHPLGGWKLPASSGAKCLSLVAAGGVG